jgi:hypothetical protein
MAQQLSVEMLQARRPERNYLSPRDSAYLEANRKTIAQMRETLGQIQNLEPEEQLATGKALDELNLYQRRFEAVVSTWGPPGPTPTVRIEAVVQAYERDLNELLTRAICRETVQVK